MGVESILGSFIRDISSLYKSFLYSLPPKAQIFLNLFLITITVAIYAIFIWKFYIFISTKDILKLNLRKYNKAKHPIMVKLVASGFYFLEYFIILPILIFFWLIIFTILLLLVTKGLEAETVILIAAITIASVRVLAYIPKYGETVSSEVAKIVPLTLLAISITNPTFFKLGQIVNELAKLPEVLSGIKYYFFFIVGVELFMRFLVFIFKFLGISKPEDNNDKLLEPPLRKKTKPIKFFKRKKKKEELYI